MCLLEKKIKNEQNDFEKLCENLPSPIIKNRIIAAGNWYIKNAIYSKAIFNVLGVVSILLPLVTTFFSDSKHQDIVRATSVLTSMVTSLTVFTKTKEKWNLYRDTIEEMKRALTLYYVVVESTDDEKLKKSQYEKLVTDLEDIMKNEHEKWKCTLTEKEKNENKGKY